MKKILSFLGSPRTNLYLLAILIGLLIADHCKSQILKKFTVASWGDQRFGYYYRPMTPGKYPVVIYFHGAGEVGSDSVSARSLLSIGPLNFIQSGWRPNLVIFAIQVSYWSPSPDMCYYILKNDPEIFPYWDQVNILWTGVSAGGQRVLEAISLKYPGSFVPMSPAALDFSKFDFSLPWHVWDFHASNDNVCPYKYSVDLVDLFNKTYPGSAKLTTYTDGHGNWNQFYNPVYKNPISIYDFAITGGLPPKKILCVITVYDDGSTETKNY